MHQITKTTVDFIDQHFYKQTAFQSTEPKPTVNVDKTRLGDHVSLKLIKKIQDL